MNRTLTFLCCFIMLVSVTAHQSEGLTKPSFLFLDDVDIHDIRTFGAVSGTDCTAAITAALNKAGSVGGYVFIPRGTWQTSSPLTVTWDNTIAGNGYHGFGTSTPQVSCHISGALSLIPQANPPSYAVEGTIYMDTDHHLYVHNGTTWVQMDN